MHEQTRIWRELGLHYVFCPQQINSDESVSGLAILHEPSIPLFFSHVHAQLQKALHIHWQRIQPPIIVFVTYACLDLDFRGSANPDRVHLVHSIIKASPWSPADVAFWPMTLFNESLSPHDSNTIFRALINELNPKYLLDFGGIASDMLFASARSNDRGRTALGSFRHVTLPALEAMLPDNKPIKKQAWDIIRTLPS